MCVDDFFLQIMLPTGTKVTVKDSYQAFINIFIYPSAADYNKTEGTVRREKNIRAIAQLIIGTYICTTLYSCFHDCFATKGLVWVRKVTKEWKLM